MIKEKLKNLREYIKVINISIKNIGTDIKYINKNKKDLITLEYKMLLYVHSLEKGMTFKNIRYGFGKAKINELFKLIECYFSIGYEVDRYAIQESLSIINTYIEFHNKNKHSVREIEDRFSLLKRKMKDPNMAGVKKIKKEELSGLNFDFEKFVSSRHSIREFSNENVEEGAIRQAISIAQNYPSACNRQPIKVYYSLEDEKNRSIDSLVPGNSGFKGMVNKYLIVTSEITAFGSQEINQWYVNGGIYLSFLLLSLHSLGLATCTFQWAEIKNKTKELKKIAKIKCSERVIAVIGVGKYVDENIVPIGTRKDIREVIQVF